MQDLDEAGWRLDAHGVVQISGSTRCLHQEHKPFHNLHDGWREIRWEAPVILPPHPPQSITSGTAWISQALLALLTLKAPSVCLRQSNLILSLALALDLHLESEPLILCRWRMATGGPLPEQWPPELKVIVTACMAQRPQDRPSADQVCRAPLTLDLPTLFEHDLDFWNRDPVHSSNTLEQDLSLSQRLLATCACCARRLCWPRTSTPFISRALYHQARMKSKLHQCLL